MELGIDQMLKLIQWHAVQKWDGRLSIVSGSGSNIIDVSKFVEKK